MGTYCPGTVVVVNRRCSRDPGHWVTMEKLSNGVANLFEERMLVFRIGHS